MVSKEELKDLVEKSDSCKIKIDKKGNWSGEVKVYADNIDNAMKKCLSKAKELKQVIAEQNNRGSK